MPLSELPVPRIVTVMPMKSVNLEIVLTLVKVPPILVALMLDALFLITENSVFVQKDLLAMPRWSVFVFPTPVSLVTLVPME